jgi:hypothetical protein
MDERYLIDFEVAERLLCHEHAVAMSVPYNDDRVVEALEEGHLKRVLADR